MPLYDGSFAPELAPLGTPVTAGTWELAVTEVHVGEDAFGIVSSDNAGNEAPDQGLLWCLAYVRATNTSDRPRPINASDFACAGSDGVLRRPPVADGPDPLLQALVGPGESVEGWVPTWINDADNVIMWFNSPFLGGSWADAWFALTDGATFPTFEPAADDPGLGAEPTAPARFNETVRAGDWDVTILQMANGQAVFDMSEFGVQALGSAGSSNWYAFQMRIRNIANAPRFFSFTALRVADPNGEPWDHLLALSAPPPDAAKELLPGATREGWATIELQEWSSLDMLRLLPNVQTDAPRYIVVDGGGSQAAAPTPEPAHTFASGDVVQLSDTPVNLRQSATSSGKVVLVLDGSSTLTVTGEPVEADGLTWYPVTVDESGETGFVVANYIEPVDN